MILGMLDGNVLDPGEFFDKLPETYVIFVTQNDTLGYGLPIAHIDRTIQENGKMFEDEARMDEKKDVAYSLADRKMSVEDISEIIKVNIETVRGWLAGHTPAKK